MIYVTYLTMESKWEGNSNDQRRRQEEEIIYDNNAKKIKFKNGFFSSPFDKPVHVTANNK